MRIFLKFVFSSVLVMVFTSGFLPALYRVKFPRNPGPILDANIRLIHKRYIEKNRPEIVLLGDSTLDDGVDTELLSQQIGTSVYSIPVHGSASAMWYLLLKNNIAVAEPAPEHVLVVFRTSVLTAPAYRVHGTYFDELDEFAGMDEPVFIEKSFTNLMYPMEIFAERYIPLYVFRTRIRREIEAGVFYVTPGLTGCNRPCVDTALNSIFYEKNLEPGVLADAVNTAEAYLYSSDRLDFEKQLAGSYLPDMIRIARDNGIKLVFVRIKIDSVDEKSNTELLNYLDSLKEYLEEQDVAYLDYGSDSRITSDMYSDTIHLNVRGEAVFTQILANDMKIIINEK